MTTITKEKVARCLCLAADHVGQAFAADEQQDVRTRTENLLKQGPYGAYVVDVSEDRGGWAPRADVVIYMEQKGTKDDCIPPLDYYGDGFDIAARASDLMGTHYIEFINAAVAAVYEV